VLLRGRIRPRPPDHDPAHPEAGAGAGGFVRQVHPERVQVLGATEISYLETLTEEAARASVEAFFSLNPACVVVTKGLEIRPSCARPRTGWACRCCGRR
jgi:hypothetical protein